MSSDTGEGAMVPDNAREVALATTDPMDRIMAAVQAGMDPAAVEKVIELQERVLDRNARMEFIDAMGKCQETMPPIPKSSKAEASRDGGRFKGYDYAKFDTIAKVVRPHAAKFGIRFHFSGETTERGVKQTCIVSHVGGHEEASSFEGPIDSGSMNAIQKVGSGRSYAKRYALIDAFGLSLCDPDDDGNAACRPTADMNAPKITDEQAANIRAKLEEIGKDEPRFLAYFSTVIGCTEPLAKVEDIPATHLGEVWNVRGMS